MSDEWGLNLDLNDFDLLLKKDDLREEPVGLEVFVRDRKYLGLEYDLSERQIEISKHITQIYKPSTLVQLMGEEKGLKYHEQYTVSEIICMLGKGSGKDHTSRVSLAYVIYLFHCLRDPLDYYGKAHGVTIDLLNLAINAQQAKNVFFEPLKKILMASPYFQEVGFEPRVSELYFFSAPIRCFSGHSESEGWEGYELLITVLDEIAAFKTQMELATDVRSKGSAEEIYNMSKVSVMSRFPKAGKVVLLSFPRFKGDFITQRYKAYSEGNELKTWGMKASTWEVNPTITREDLEPEFRRNPVQARSRFMCEPPEMEDAFFREPDLVRKAFTYGEDPVDEDGTWKKWFVGTDGFPRFIHIDLGLKKDDAAMAMVHISGLKEVQTLAGIERLPIINVDFVKVWHGTSNKEINFSDIRGTVAQLGKKFSIAKVTADMWSSIDMLQTLKSWNYNAEWHTVKKTDYDTLQTAIYDGRLRGYWNEQLVENELLQLRLINNTKVDHPTCLVGETRIPTLDGTTYEIKDLIGKEFYVYSSLPDGSIVPGKATAKISLHTSSLIDVVLDSGAVIRCTRDHPFLLKNGEYKRAFELRPGIDRLMPITRNWPVNGGYERITDGNGVRTLTHHMVAQHFDRKILPGEYVHHKDENKINNNPDNLEILTDEEHSYHHAIDRHNKDLKWREKLSEGTIKFNKLNSTREKRSLSMKSRSNEWYLERAHKNRNFRSDITFNMIEKTVKNDSEALNPNATARILGCSRNVIMRILKENDISWGDLVNKSKDNNHKIRELHYITLENEIPVYDLIVETYQNFALSSGVIVHNTGKKDIADAIAGATFQCLSNMEIEIETEIEIWNDDYVKDSEKTIEEIAPKPKQEEEIPEDLKAWLMELL